uniref:Uncharacterized protein n=1 Tax=Rhizophora mucronata TaxID=61149 RepID=A0A2P2K2Y6_RHIMU
MQSQLFESLIKLCCLWFPLCLILYIKAVLLPMEKIFRL